MKTDAPLKIVALQSENVKRLRAVHIRPDGSLIVIKGENGAGKSSVLDSIAYALGGEKLCPPQVIRRGETSAKVSVDLGEYIVTRRWTASGSTLTVETPEGASYKSPQGILDKLVGRLSFDPLAFTREEPKKQAEILRKVVGLDFTELDIEREQLYADRTMVNREVVTIRGSLARKPEVDAPDDPVSVQELLKEQEQILAQQRELEEAQRAAQIATGKREQAQKALSSAQLDVEQLEKRLAQARNIVEAREKELTAAEEAEDAAGGRCADLPAPDLAGIRKKLADAEGINTRVRQKHERAAEAKKLAAKEAESKKLTEQITALDATKAALLAEAKFPVNGLSFTADGVTFDGLPLEQASAAEQLRVSLAVGLALNPKLKVLLIRDGSLLDEKSMRLVAEQAESAGAQVWCEVVGKAGRPGVVIEDGQVEDAAASPEEAA